MPEESTNISDLRICMACDFFYPNFGGVEGHIFSLSQSLLLRANKVIVITHCYGNRHGIRYMVNGLKVYYLPMKVIYNQTTMPTMVASIPLIRHILLRERINIVHGHAAFSALAHETILIAQLLNIKTVFTDHSLFGFADLSAIITNKCIEISLAGCNHLICVSHTGKENTVLRSNIEPNLISVIPNAVDCTVFKPDLENRMRGKIVIVYVCRLVYRKGVDLLAYIMVHICQKYPDIFFLVGGDGPKRKLLLKTREKYNLETRVELVGGLKHSEVRNILTKGHIFLNTSLTEAYCMAIVEAASCGLQVVTTRVGGIPEVLPPDLVYLCEPNVSALMQGVEIAISDYKRGNFVDPLECHRRIRSLYNWKNISERTEIVYRKALQQPDKTIGGHLRTYKKAGVYPFLLIVSLVFWILNFLNWFVPTSDIDIAEDIHVINRTSKSIHKDD